jgi:hypothetical protein
MTVNHCADCKHFGAADSWPHSPTAGYGTCRLSEGGGYPTNASGGWHAAWDEWQRSAKPNDRWPRPADWPPMFAEDGSGYFAILRVLPSHGCNAWTPVAEEEVQGGPGRSPSATYESRATDA